MVSALHNDLPAERFSDVIFRWWCAWSIQLAFGTSDY